MLETGPQTLASVLCPSPTAGWPSKQNNERPGMLPYASLLKTPSTKSSLQEYKISPHYQWSLYLDIHSCNNKYRKNYTGATWIHPWLWAMHRNLFSSFLVILRCHLLSTLNHNLKKYFYVYLFYCLNLNVIILLIDLWYSYIQNSVKYLTENV